jgi:hypothetical protein
VKSLQIFVQILNFLNTFVMDAVYVIDQQAYRPSYLKYYEIHSKVFKVLWKIVLDIGQTDIVVSQNLIKIIPKFWNVFVEHRNEMIPDIVFLLKAILAAQFVDSLNLAVKFLFEVFTDCKVDPGMKSYLKSEVFQLFVDKGFGFYLKVGSSVESFKINHGFPLLTVVEAGEIVRVRVLVRPKSYLYCAFVLDSYDIEFSITFYKKSEEKELIYKEKYFSSAVPCEKRVFFEYEGNVCIEWDNSFSWINSKSIRHRILVLDEIPYNTLPSLPIPTSNSPIPSTPSSQIQVFGILDEHHLRLFSNDVKQVDHFSPEDPSKTIIEYMSKNKKDSLSLLTSNDSHSLDLLNSADIVWAFDIEAAGKFAWKALKEDSLVIVSNIPNLRFSIFLNGKVIRTKMNHKKINQTFDEMIQEILEVFHGKVVLFRVEGKNEWIQKLRNRGIEVSDLEIDVETLVVELRALLY